MKVEQISLFPDYIMCDYTEMAKQVTCIASILGIPCITDCVMAEIEKLGLKYRVALR